MKKDYEIHPVQSMYKSPFKIRGDSVEFWNKKIPEPMIFFLTDIVKVQEFACIINTKEIDADEFQDRM